jgi:hypothetical protein
LGKTDIPRTFRDFFFGLGSLMGSLLWQSTVFFVFPQPSQGPNEPL